MTKDIEKTIDCEGIQVCYSDRTNGAGLETRFDFTNAIQRLFPNRIFNRCYEWCSGPAFFGYSLLGKGVCHSLYLADIFEPAVAQASKTAQNNNLKAQVEVVLSDNWQNIPVGEQFDLIVSNPPHFCLQNYYNEIWTYEKRIYIDKDWNTHRDFFAGVKKHLAPDGEIVLMECAWGSGVNTFLPMIEAAGLQVAQHFLGDYQHEKLGFPIYYLNIRHK